MDLPVVEALLDGGLDQTVLVEPREPLELSCVHGSSQVLATAVFVLDRYLSARERRADHRFQLAQINHAANSMVPVLAG